MSCSLTAFFSNGLRLLLGWRFAVVLWMGCVFGATVQSTVLGQDLGAARSLEAELQRVDAGALAEESRKSGDATRGALLFFRADIACSKCHVVGDTKALGPDLSALGAAVETGAVVEDRHLVESLLFPSRKIRDGYKKVSVLTLDGRVVTGVLKEESKKSVTVQTIADMTERVVIERADIDEILPQSVSTMPTGQVNLLGSRQAFLDIVRYLIEIRDGGARRAEELRPAASQLALAIPEYEKRIDHAGMIRAWNSQSLERGEAIYNRVCANCHGTVNPDGTVGQEGSLPTSLKFASGKFKNGSDPHAMYRTLTYGYEFMTPQSWMVPSQKYDVIHYIRERYLKDHNADQYSAVDAAYLSQLPAGDTFGPEPSKIQPWSAMDYGPSLTHTYQIPGPRENFAYKGLAIRLDGVLTEGVRAESLRAVGEGGSAGGISSSGGISAGSHWMVFDTDTLRMAAGWKAEANASGRFIDWRGIQFDGAHGVHPRIVGEVAFQNSTGPGWADPETGLFADDARVLGRDGKRYGPLPNHWGKFLGTYRYGHEVVLAYRVGDSEVLELPGVAFKRSGGGSLLTRTFNVGPRNKDLLLQVAEHTHEDAEILSESAGAVGAGVVQFGKIEDEGVSNSREEAKIHFDGETYLEVSDPNRFDLRGQNFAVRAKIKTDRDGTIISVTEPGSKWVPNGQALFVRNGRLAFDIGWVGAVAGETNVADGSWHEVEVQWERASQKIRLYVDGRLDGEGRLAAKGKLKEPVFRIGFTAPNFPEDSYFVGDIERVEYHRGLLIGPARPEQKDVKSKPSESLVWNLLDAKGTDAKGTGAKGAGANGTTVAGTITVAGTKNEGDAGKDGNGKDGNGLAAVVRRGQNRLVEDARPLWAGVAPGNENLKFEAREGKLVLRIAAGDEPLRFTLWQSSPETESVKLEKNGSVGSPSAGQRDVELGDYWIDSLDRDLSSLTTGGPSQWGHTLRTRLILGDEQGPFASEELEAPEVNPWLAQTRFTGLDFYDDGRLAVCSWDGDVWTALVDEEARVVHWRRIASGLFQPLGLKIVNQKIHVMCRDQLVVLHDLNGDGETDFYQCLNNDHQVTEHFHEFAMGLQVDDEGNFYYAKSGQHGLAALVPHHGTLLKIAKDGSQTSILANGFRAANGVCLNPDGSFFVTDQEGFWNPKNRINWVTVGESTGTQASIEPKFYGNMLGYHQVTDAGDEAMEPPLCWITNAMDRSPGELLWVESEKWGELDGALLNLSYGYGKVFLVLQQRVGSLMQGGVIQLPMEPFPTGVMRGRFHPHSRDLYLCGMFAWAGDATKPGGLYRLRPTGKPHYLPTNLRATVQGLELVFSEPIESPRDAGQHFTVKVWDLKRTANYGSKHYNERQLEVRGASVSDDGRTVLLDVKDLQPTWCMEIAYELRGKNGEEVRGVIHNTIHELEN